MKNHLPLRIVTVAFNPGPDLASMAASLENATSSPYELVIVDNGSDPTIVDDVARRFGAQVIRTGENLGYGRAANLGLAETTSEWGVVVNPDVVFDRGSLDSMLHSTGSWPRGGAFGPLILTEEGEVYPSARRFPRLVTGIGHAVLAHVWDRNPFTRAYKQAGSIEDEHPVDWLSGACLLVRMEAFREVGGFDDSYFMFFEDTQLGEQLKAAGWQSVYLPLAKIYHEQGSSWKDRPATMLRAHHRSAAHYLDGVYPRPAQAPLRMVLRGALWLRGELQVFLSRVKRG